MSRGSPKVLVIGLDGATFDVIRPMIDDGDLPAIKRMMETGAHGVLRSVIPPVSPSAWASFATGVNPGKHGIFGFTASERGVSVIDSARTVAVPLWETLAARGRKPCIVSVPFTYPPKPMNGIAISGMGTPLQDSDFAYPPELKERLFGLGYRPEFDRRCVDDDEWFDREMGERVAGLETATKHLMQEADWDFFMVVFGATDHAQHIFWKDLDADHPQSRAGTGGAGRNRIHEYYRMADRFVAELAALAGEGTNIIIMSDHGGAPVYKRIALNNWLAEQGFLRFKTGAGPGAPAQTPDLGAPALKKARAASIQRRFARKRTGLLLAAYGVTYRASVSLLGALGLKRFIPRSAKAKLKSPRQIAAASGRGLTKNRSFNQLVDWENTRAYAEQPYGQVFITIDRGDERYTRVRQDLAERLRLFTDPETGEKVMSRVYMKEELFQGQFVGRAPDIYAAASPTYEIVGYSPEGDVFLPPFRSGTHSEDGILICSGPDFKSGHELQGATIMDVAPTILHMMGYALSSSIDGRPLTDAFREGSEPATRDVAREAVPDEKWRVRRKIDGLKRTGRI